MTDGNGTAPPPELVLGGHLVVYTTHIAFRPDGGDDESLIFRPMIPMALGQMVALLTPGDGGILAAVMNGVLPGNRATRRAAVAAAKAAGVELPSGT